MYMYFAMLAPTVTFGGLLGEATGYRMVIFYSLLSNNSPLTKVARFQPGGDGKFAGRRHLRYLIQFNRRSTVDNDWLDGTRFDIREDNLRNVRVSENVAPVFLFENVLKILFLEINGSI